MWRFGLGLLIVGGILAFVGFNEWRVARTASAEPEEIALKDLIARGPEGNPNIVLKDYQLCENLVVETRHGSDRWNKVWVPIVPAGQVPVGGQVTRVQALLFSTKAKDEAELDRRCGTGRMTALVTNKLMSLGSEERDLLRKRYPDTDFSTCLIIQDGREPASPVKLAIMGGGGSLAFLAGAGLLVFGLVRNRQEERPRRRVRVRGPRREEPEDDLEGEDEEPRPRRRRPRPVEDVEEVEEEEDPRPRRRRPVEDDDDEPRPRRRRPVDE